MNINIYEYINPKLMVIVAVCYICGVMLKKTPYIKDWLIPYILTAKSIALCFLWFFAHDAENKYIVEIIFEAITQGFLCSASTVFLNQIIKQTKKKKQTFE